MACELGQLQVAYREGLLQETHATAVLEHTVGVSRHRVAASVTLTPAKTSHGMNVTFRPRVEGRTERQALASAVESSLGQGPLLGFPVLGVAVSVGELTGRDVAPLSLLCGCLSKAVQKALQGASVELLEPLVDVEVTVPDEHLGAVLSDLTCHRRAQVKGVSEDVGGEKVVAAHVPLAALLGYAKELRSMTSGAATFTMTSSGHCPVDRQQQSTIVQQLRGY